MVRQTVKHARGTVSLIAVDFEKNFDQLEIWFATLEETKILVTPSKHSTPFVLVRDTLRHLNFAFSRLMLRRFSPFILDNSLHRWLPDLGSGAPPRLFLHHQPRLFPSPHNRSLRPKPNTFPAGPAAA